jgi:hypothetical protein
MTEVILDNFQTVVMLGIVNKHGIDACNTGTSLKEFQSNYLQAVRGTMAQKRKEIAALSNENWIKLLQDFKGSGMFGKVFVEAANSLNDGV